MNAEKSGKSQVEAMNRIWAVAQRMELDTELLLNIWRELTEARWEILADKQIEAIIQKAEEEEL